MSCVEFLEYYSDYRDGAIADSVLCRRLERHLRTCPICMRYDARLARGITVLRTFSDLEPSRGFSQTLAGRLRSTEVEEEDPVTPGRPSVMIGLMVAAALALLFWGGDRQSVDAPVAAGPPATQPLPAVVANAGIPFVSFADLSVPSFAPTSRAPGANDQTFFTLTATAP
jgi:hypothetical protein